MLQGLGTAIALPLLEVMDQPGLRAAVTTPRPRLAYLYIPNGVAAGAWQPEEVGSDGKLQQLNRWMEPLNPFRDQLTVFRNLWTPRGNGHAAGTATWLTGGGFDHIAAAKQPAPLRRQTGGHGDHGQLPGGGGQAEVGEHETEES